MLRLLDTRVPVCRLRGIMDYPGHVTKFGDSDQPVVKAIQAELVTRGCGPVDPPGVFGAQTEAAVKFFQARHVDAHGLPLEQDGKVGALTWGALFGIAAIPSAIEAGSPFLQAVLETAAAKVGVLEQPKNSNSGPDVDEFLRRAGVALSLPAAQKPWCCAFVYWCFDETARRAGRANPMMRTASCLDHWAGAANHGGRRIRAIDATDDPSLVRPGMVFVQDHGAGRGHTGLIERFEHGFLQTIEGNTDASRTREGGGVYRLKRKLAEVNTGFIDYTRA